LAPKSIAPYKKSGVSAMFVSLNIRNNPEDMEIRLTARPISRITDFAGFQAASELVFRSSPINGTPVGPITPFLDFPHPMGFGPVLSF
jgi:hypothetical protein